MAKISNTLSYPNQAPIEGGDYLIGTAANSTPIVKQTKTFTLSDIANFVIDQAFDGDSYRLPLFTAPSEGQESFELGNSLFYQDAGVLTASIVYLDNGSGVGSLSIAQDLTVGRDALIYGKTSLEGLTTVNGGIYFRSEIYDANGDIGNTEQVLVSDSSGNVTWQNYQGSGLEFQGAWNADTNTPDLQAISLISGNTGKYWVVSVAGTTDLSGITDWESQDWAIISEDDAGNVFWAKIDNSPVITGSGTVNTLPLWTGTQTLGDSFITQDLDALNNPLVTVNGNIIIGSNNESTIDIKSNDSFELFLGESTASQINLKGKNNSLAAGYFLAKWNGDTTTINPITGRYLIQDMPNGIFNFDARPWSAIYSTLFQLTSGYGNHKFSITQDGGSNQSGTVGPSFNLGGVAYANGADSVAMGTATTAFGKGSLAANFLTLASGGGASAFGLLTEASGLASAVFGNKSIASGPYSIASGQDSIASGQSAVAIGEKGDAKGKNSFVQGFGGIADANNAAKFGYLGQATAANSFVLGFESDAGANNSIAGGFKNEVRELGTNSFAVGSLNVIESPQSIVAGSNNSLGTTAANSFATGTSNSVRATDSVAGGQSNVVNATGSSSAAFGNNNSIDDEVSFVSGKNNNINTGAAGSAAFGETNEVSGQSSLVSGKGNSALAKYTFATGNDNEVLAENAFAAGTENISTAFQSVAFGKSTEARGENSFTSGQDTIASGVNSFAGGKLTNASAERAVALGNENTSSGTNSFSIGFGNTAGGANSVAIGISNDARGIQSFVTGNSNTSTGTNASIFGQNNESSANQSFIAGGTNIATGQTAMILGAGNEVSSNAGIAIGGQNIVSGAAVGSIAIGKNIALNDASPTLALGWNLVDGPTQGQVVIGQYNSTSTAKVVIGSGLSGNTNNGIEVFNDYINLGKYGAGTVTGVPNYNLVVQSDGKILEAPLVSGYTVLVQLITQTGVNAPTASTLINNLENQGTLTWIRNSNGDYSLTSTSTPFVSGKTIVFVNGGSSENNHDIAWERISDSEIKILTHNSDDKLTNGSLEIRKYY